MKTSFVVVLITTLLSSAITLKAQSSFTMQAAAKPNPDILSRVTKVKGLKFVSSMSSAPVNSAAPADLFCLENFGLSCYSPQQIRRAYGLTSILDAGYTGAGQTIIIVDSFGSPTIAQDVQAFDAGYNLPDPPSLTVLTPLGTVPFDPTNSVQVGWAFETTLDVEWAHALAPGANIVLLTSPVAETQGIAGLPQFLFLENYALNHNLGKIISQSWGTAENTLFDTAGQQVLANFESFYQNAAQQNVTVLSGSGDSGSSNIETNQTAYFPFPTVEFPASSPFVTAVGGTSLYADGTGNYEYEAAWIGSGGGVSQQFAEPSYQSILPTAVQQTLANHRGVPDVAFNADPATAILVYTSFIPNASGYYFINGTSEGPPQWAAIIADANQLAGHPLGFLNPKLYALGASGGQSNLFHDITFGSNAFNGPAGVPGYTATTGWDLTTGWGTPNLGKLVWELAKQQ